MENEKARSKKEIKKEKKQAKKEEKRLKKEAIKAEKEVTVKTKKKVRIKNKKIFIPIILVLVILLTIAGYFGYQAMKKNTLKGIKTNYNEYVVTKKTTKLYNKNKKMVGTIAKDYELELEKIKKPSLKNTHLKIKDTDYYVYYKDIKKSEKKEEKVEESYYLPLEKSIESTKEIILYDGKKKVITLKNGIKDAIIERMDKDNYYVYFLNKTLRVPKSKDIKVQDAKVLFASPKADHISVIYYDKIKEDCGGDETCLRPVSVRAHLNLLKSEKYYLITKEDYIDYLNGNKNFKEKAVFIATGEENDAVKGLKENIYQIEEKDGIKLTVTNKTSTPKDEKDKVNCYQAKSYTTIDKYVSMATGIDVPDNGRETYDNQGIAVLNYHFFYDDTIPGERYACNESICLEREKFKEHLQWLKDNGYKTLTIHEFADWMDGIIELPEKSVLLTIDDGAHGTGLHNGNVLIPLLEEYKIHATLFLITGWWDLSNYQSPYLDVQSHTNNLHYEASCPDGRGMVACSDYETVKKDIQQSLDILRDNTSFCFPFYSADREGIQAVKDLGFRVSFVGGSVKAKRSNDHYLIPRYPILDDITLNEFISMVQ